jgi:hypothetical protein
MCRFPAGCHGRFFERIERCGIPDEVPVFIGFTAPTAPRAAQWFTKPAGMSYGQLFAAVEPTLAPVGGSLWIRKMTLGPALEFCVLSREPAALAPQFQMFAFQLRPVWDGVAAAAATG